MSVLNLYKNDVKVLSKEGINDNNKYVFENIIYDRENIILIREDNNFKYELNFKEENATIVLKMQDYVLNMELKVLNKELNDNCHKITYNIESEEVISNVLEIKF